MIEAHSTGTGLGDPIEISSISAIVKKSGHKTCSVCAIKGNVGHTKSTAGVANVIEVLCARIVAHGGTFFEADEPEFFEKLKFDDCYHPDGIYGWSRPFPTLRSSSLLACRHLQITTDDEAVRKVTSTLVSLLQSADSECAIANTSHSTEQSNSSHSTARVVGDSDSS